MKSNHPLISALKNGPKKMPSTMGRTLTITTADIPDLKNSKVGDAVTVYVTGKVNSIHDDGRIVVEVSSVTPNAEREDDDEMTKKPLMVMTQESNAG